MTQPPDETTGRRDAAWPTVPASSPTAPSRASFAAAPPQPVRRLRRHHLFGLLGLSLLVASGLLVLVVFLLRAPPQKHCTRLFECGGPIAHGRAVRNGRVYTSKQFGFTVEYPSGVPARTSATGIIVSYAGNMPLETGTVQIAGLEAPGASASDVVQDVVQQIASNATAEYQVPNPYIGDVPAVGEAYNVVEDGSSSSTGLDRLIVLAAVRGNLAIVVVDMGPYWQFSSSNTVEMQINDHPSPADQYAALFADPMVNSVVWPKSSG